MLRTTLVVSSMRGGGAERVVSHMANYWARKGWGITVLTLFHGPESPSYALDARVRHHDMGFAKRVRHPIPNARAVRAVKAIFDRASAPERRTLLRDLDLIAALRHAIRVTSPDLVIALIDATNVRVLLAAEGLGVPVIVSERSDPLRNVLPEGLRRLRQRLYPKAAFLVAPTREMAAFFTAEMGDRGRVIHNPVVRPVLPAPSNGTPASAKTGRTLVAMGRLVEEKGFSLLLRAFAQIANRHPAWSLEIWGVGPLGRALELLARRLQLEGRVKLNGFTHRPMEMLARADLFALPSLSEGFPNALCEAMACGLPVVSFDCSSGVRQIIRDGVDGVIVPSSDVASLAGALDRLMADDVERARLGARAVDVVERFALEKTMAQWEALAWACLRRPAPGPEGPGAVAAVSPAVSISAPEGAGV